MVILIYIFGLMRWEVTDKDPRIEKWTLFSRLKSGCPIHVMYMKEDFATNT